MLKALNVLLAFFCLVLSALYLFEGIDHLGTFWDVGLDTAFQQNAVATYAVGKLMIALVFAVWALLFVVVASHKDR